ncbi:hypothetical protein GCM10009742_35190 [Kribbella karoonensis]|uniref:Uncharacterized protein n=1 Tax=Kribbella karoonensis TaxID=324851 RepID=A0ABN2DTK2_9ACTN
MSASTRSGALLSPSTEPAPHNRCGVDPPTIPLYPWLIKQLIAAVVAGGVATTRAHDQDTATVRPPRRPDPRAPRLIRDPPTVDRCPSSPCRLHSATDRRA